MTTNNKKSRLCISFPLLILYISFPAFPVGQNLDCDDPGECSFSCYEGCLLESIPGCYPPCYKLTISGHTNPDYNKDWFLPFQGRDGCNLHYAIECCPDLHFYYTHAHAGCGGQCDIEISGLVASCSHCGTNCLSCPPEEACTPPSGICTHEGVTIEYAPHDDCEDCNRCIETTLEVISDEVCHYANLNCCPPTDADTARVTINCNSTCVDWPSGTEDACADASRVALIYADVEQIAPPGTALVDEACVEVRSCNSVTFGIGGGVSPSPDVGASPGTASVQVKATFLNVYGQELEQTVTVQVKPQCNGCCDPPCPDTKEEVTNK